MYWSEKENETPYCDEYAMGEVPERKEDHETVYESIRNATDPYFHYPLYLQTCFQGKTIWALNVKHLQYLIDYLSADIRTISFDYY